VPNNALLDALIQNRVNTKYALPQLKRRKQVNSEKNVATNTNGL